MARENPQRILALLSMAALIGYGGLLFTHMATGVGGSDSSGYANTARDILSGRIVVPIVALPRLDLPDRFAPALRPLAYEAGPRPGTMSPMYPPGFPLHVAAAALLAGWDAGPFVLSPILALLTVVLTYSLGRELSLSRPIAASGAAIFAACPVVLFQAVQPMSDVAAAAWCVAAVLFALRARRSAIWALPAGAAFGIAVLVRPADALLILPLAFALPWKARPLAFFVSGGAPFALFYGLWNRAAFGGPFHTGYGGPLSTALALPNFAPQFRLYGTWIVGQVSPLAPVGWLASAFSPSLRARDRALLFTWFASFFLFYCFWAVPHAWWFTRFLIPALPPLVLGFLVALRDLIRGAPEHAVEGSGRRGVARSLVAAAALLVVVGFEARMDLASPRPYLIGRGHVAFPEACRALVSRAEGSNAVVVSMELSGAVRFYTDFAPVRWDLISAEDFALLRSRAAGKGYRVFAALLPEEVPLAHSHVPGDWTYVGNVRAVSLWELPANASARER